MITLWRGRAKTVRGIWYQGKAGAGLPRIDASNAAFVVVAHTLDATPQIVAANAAQGEFDLIFGVGCTANLAAGQICTITLALDFAGGASPDPVEVPVTIL